MLTFQDAQHKTFKASHDYLDISENSVLLGCHRKVPQIHCNFFFLIQTSVLIIW